MSELLEAGEAPVEAEATPAGGVANEDMEDPLWGEVLSDVDLEVDVAFTADEVRDAFEESQRLHRDAARAAEDAEQLKDEAAEFRKRSKDKAAEAETLRKKGDEAGARALAKVGRRVRKCLARLREVDGERRVYVLHPETYVVLEVRDLTEEERQPQLFADPAREAEDAGAGVDRDQIHARLKLLETQLAILRGPLAVPTRTEIDSWSSGVAQATQRWLDAIDADEQLPPAPIWVAGFRGAQQEAFVPGDVSLVEQIRVLKAALQHGIDPVMQALAGLADDGDGSIAKALAMVATDTEVKRIGAPGPRLNLGVVVEQMKALQVRKGTTAHLATLARVVAEDEGLPLFRVSVAQAEDDELRLLHFVVLAKPAPDGMAAADLKTTIIAGAEKALAL